MSDDQPRHVPQLPEKVVETIAPLIEKLLSDYLSLNYQLLVATPKSSAATHAACRTVLGHLELVMAMMESRPSVASTEVCASTSENLGDLLAAARDVLERHPVLEE